MNHADTTRHINGEVRTVGGRQVKVTSGLWTRQRGGISTVIDYVLITAEHMDTVISMEIDDQGKYGGNSDHNWVSLKLRDEFTLKVGRGSSPVRRREWDIRDDLDWSMYKDHARQIVSQATPEQLKSVEGVASAVSKAFFVGLNEGVGYKYPRKRVSRRKLPPHLVSELNHRRHLERSWKTVLSSLDPGAQEADRKFVNDLERLCTDQKERVTQLLASETANSTSRTKEFLRDHPTRARKCFWADVTGKVKSGAQIPTVLNETTGELTSDPQEISSEVSEHLKKVFLGEFQPIPLGKEHELTAHDQLPLGDHAYATEPGTNNHLKDHTYCKKAERGPPNDHTYAANLGGH